MIVSHSGIFQETFHFNISHHLLIFLGIPLAFLDYTTDKPPHNDRADENPMAVSQRRTITNSELPTLTLSEFPQKLPLFYGTHL